MKCFKDNEGRSWTVNVNVAAIKRVKSLLDVNLMDTLEGDLLRRLALDPILLCDVVYAVCKPDADARNISDEQFGQAMAGDVIEQATLALLEELADFFPEGKRQVLKKALNKLKNVEEKALETANHYLDSPELDRKVDEEVKKLIGYSGNSEELPESIPSR